MALIGLHDVDMTIHLHVPFNLEIMKLSTYHKRRGHIVVAAPRVDKSLYTHTFIRKDYDDGVMPKVRPGNSFSVGGLAYTGGVYNPMEYPVELCKPDTHIYDNYAAEFGTGARYKRIFRRMVDSAHGRLSLDGRTLWEDWEKPFGLTKKVSNIYLHDIDLPNIVGVKDAIKDIQRAARKNTVFSTKFPLQISNYEDLIYWGNLSGSVDPISIRYTRFIEDEEWMDLVNRFFVPQIPPIFLQYFVTSGCKSEQDFVDNRLLNVFLQAEILRNKQRKILLNYEDGFFQDRRWARLIRLFNIYLSSTSRLSRFDFLDYKEDTSIYFFARILKDPRQVPWVNYPFSKEELRDLFYLVREKCPELFELFYKADFEVKLKGGKLVYE